MTLKHAISRTAFARAARTHTFSEIADSIGVSQTTVGKLAKKWGISPPDDAGKRGGRPRRLPPLEILEAELAAGKTLKTLADELGSTPSSLRVTMNRDRRLRAEAAKGEAA